MMTLRLLKRKNMNKLNVNRLFFTYYFPVMAKSMDSRDRARL